VESTLHYYIIPEGLTISTEVSLEEGGSSSPCPASHAEGGRAHSRLCVIHLGEARPDATRFYTEEGRRKEFSGTHCASSLQEHFHVPTLDTVEALHILHSF